MRIRIMFFTLMRIRTQTFHFDMCPDLTFHSDAVQDQAPHQKWREYATSGQKICQGSTESLRTIVSLHGSTMILLAQL